MSQQIGAKQLGHESGKYLLGGQQGKQNGRWNVSCYGPVGFGLARGSPE